MFDYETIRLIWWLFIGWWASGIAVTIAWIALITIIGIPLGIVLSALLAEGAPIMVQARQLGLNVPIIGGNGMNSVKVFDLAKDKADGLYVGSPWSIENQSEANRKFVVAYTSKFKSAPDQFAAQAYDALNITVKALKGVKLSGNLEADRAAVRNALPEVKWNGATDRKSVV